MNWKVRQHRFAAFASETMETLGGERECSSGEQLAEVEDEIAQLEERPQALKVARQELAEEVADQQCEEVCVTVSELAANVTSQMLEVTFSQIALVVRRECSMMGNLGDRWVGVWGVVGFGEAADAVEAADRFRGVELASRPMVVEIGDGREWDESLGESQRERWTRTTSKAVLGYAADAVDAAERLNAVGFAGMGVVAGVEDSSTVAAVGAACSGCGGGSAQWLWWGQQWRVAVVEAAVASGW